MEFIFSFLLKMHLKCTCISMICTLDGSKKVFRSLEKYLCVEEKYLRSQQRVKTLPGHCFQSVVCFCDSFAQPVIYGKPEVPLNTILNAMSITHTVHIYYA